MARNSQSVLNINCPTGCGTSMSVIIDGQNSPLTVRNQKVLKALREHGESRILNPCPNAKELLEAIATVERDQKKALEGQYATVLIEGVIESRQRVGNGKERQ